jgi:phosphate transport system permease protein
MSMMTTTPRQKRADILQRGVFGLSGLATVVVCIPVVIVTTYVLQQGASAISWSFIFDGPVRDGRQGGFWPVIVLTMYSLILVLLMAIPVGVMAAIYLTEYARAGRLLRIINLTIVNLAGVPSVVYGLFGAAFFYDVLNGQQSLWVASATLAVQALAIIITSSREALLSVPQDIRQGSMAMGVSKLRTTIFITLPQAIPGIITGALLAISRAAGETAPIIVVGAILAKNVDLGPSSIVEGRPQMLSFEIYGRITEGIGFPDERKWGLALLLLAVVLTFNIAALLLRFKIQSSGIGRRN